MLNKYLSLIFLSIALMANDQISVQLLWKHQFEFAGFYVAKQKGFYKDVGLDVDIKEYQVDTNIVQDVLKQKSTFGVGYPDVVLQGNKVVLLSAFLQTSAHVIATTNPNIKTIKDFKNKTIMIGEEAKKDVAFVGMLSTQNLTFNDLTTVKPTFNIQDLIDKKCDLKTIFISNEAYELDKQHIKYRIFDPRDYGYDFYTDILFSSSQYTKQHPQIVDKFNKATKKGWIWAFNHIDQSVDIILKNYNTNKTKEQLIYEAGVLKSLAFYKTNDFGKIKKSRIKEIYDIYYMLDMVTKDVNFNEMIFDIKHTEPISPIPLHPVYDHKKAKLGKKLFYDTRLSRNNTVNCATCHILQVGGDDNAQFSTGINGSIGSINSPTVLNAKYNISQFWDGRAKDLQEQAMGPVQNPVEMGYNFPDLIKRLKQDKELLAQFKEIYKDGITKYTITDAIAEFEKALTTPNAPFDKYLRGDKNAISKDAKEGYKLFKKLGCIACHNGINLGGNLYQKVGVYYTFSTQVKSLGMMSLTGNVIDKNYFKVPTLRNISQTAPYFHSGDIQTLKEAVEVMGKMQLGIDLSKDQVDKIIKFLKTLDGEQPQIIKDEQ